jgi:hypothetical protein
MASYALGPINSNQDLTLIDADHTYYISDTVDAHDHKIKIVAKNIIVQPRVIISGAELDITCETGVFITLGTIDAPRVNINAAEVYFGGHRTARTEDVTIEADADEVYFGDDNALEAVERIVKEFANHRAQPPASCHYLARVHKR